MKQSIYIETSFISYLVARPSRDIVAAARQQISRDWWSVQQNKFCLYTSVLVVDELSRGDRDAASRRLDIVKNIPILKVDDTAGILAKELLKKNALPENALDDALHISIAAVHGIHYLLTWNFRHIDNAETKPIVRSVCNNLGFVCPEICTPAELMGAMD